MTTIIIFFVILYSFTFFYSVFMDLKSIVLLASYQNKKNGLYYLKKVSLIGILFYKKGRLNKILEVRRI